MTTEPTAPGFEWVRCVNAVPGQPHFPCQQCEWKQAAPPPAPPPP